MGSVVTGFGQGREALCHDRGPILLCRYREFSVVIENLRRSVATENLLSRQGQPFGVATQPFGIATGSGWLGDVTTERAHNSA